MDIAKVIAVTFSEPQKCYGHCEEKANLRFLRSSDVVVACYACPAGYVSKIMAYGQSPTLQTLKAILTEALEEGSPPADEDLRTATRHVWDLRTSNSDICACYWTQNYRRGKSDDPDRKALFTCGRCSALFIQPVSRLKRLCPRCSA